MERSIDLKEKASGLLNEGSIDVSIIISCKNEASTLKPTVNSIIQSNNLLSFEIIIVDDGSVDESTEFLKSNLNKKIYNNVKVLKTDNLGVSGARNAGCKIARGNYLLFCDAHVKVPDRWLDNLVNTLKNADAHIVAPCIINMLDASSIGYGMTCDNQLTAKWLTRKSRGIVEIPFACGCAFVIYKEVFNKINGFDHFFQVYGSEDFEICLKAWLYGYKVVLNPEIEVQHLFKEKHPYQILYTNIIYNILCLAYSHFKKERLIKTIEMLKSNFFFSTIVEDIKPNLELILKQREKYFNERIYDDDYFFKKFNINF